MSAWRGWLVRLRRGVRREAFEAEMAEEMRAHLELEAAARRARGEAPADAGRAAALAFGHVESLKETVRDRRLGGWLGQWWQDVRYGARLLRKWPTFSAVVIATIAVGVGGAATIFSVFDAALLRPLPFPDADRLVRVFELHNSGRRNSVAGGAFVDWRTNTRLLDSAVLVGPATANLRRGGGPAIRISGMEVTHEYTRVFGVPPILGRGFGPEDDRVGGRSDVVILMEGLWRSQFAADPSIVGTAITLDEQPRTVIGILPDGAGIEREVEFLIPSVLDPATYRGLRAGHWAAVIARLRPGVTVAQADAELKAIKRRMNDAYPAFKRDWSVEATGLQADLAREVRPLLIALTAAVALVLLIACANIANLLLARAWLRAREVALRAALGAGSGRLVRQLLTESALLAIAGGAAGLGLASLAIGLVADRTREFLPPAMAPTLDLRVAAGTAALAILTGLLFGLLPAWRARRPNLMDTLRLDGPTATARRSRTQSLLVVGQVALTVVLLVSAGLFGRSLLRAVNADPGFAPHRAIAFDLSLPDATYPERESQLAFSTRLLTRLRAQPGVEAAGSGLGLPFAGGGFGEMFAAVPEAQEKDLLLSRVNYVSDGYFEALGVRLLAGRFLTADDNRPDARRVAVINETLARHFFRDGEAVGRDLYWQGPWAIVGVVADVVDRRLDLGPVPRLYGAQAIRPGGFSIVVGTAGDPAPIAATLARTVREVDPGVAAVNVRVLADDMDRSMTDRRLGVTIVVLFAAVALALASLGVYGVMADAVSARRRELCLRIALGAGRGAVIRSVVAGGLALAGAGLALGAAGAAAAGPLLSDLLYQVRPSDPTVFAGALLTLAAVAALACVGPAIRATRLDAIAALREP